MFLFLIQMKSKQLIIIGSDEFEYKYDMDNPFI